MDVLPVTAVPRSLLAAGGRRLGRYRLRLLSMHDEAEVVALRDCVLGRLEHPDLYVREDDESVFVRKHLSGHACSRGETIGVFDGKRLVGYAMLGLPEEDDAQHPGRWIPQAGRALAEVAHLASCMVHPDHRGHRLQRTLLGARLAHARALGRPLAVAMLSLHNHASRHNLLRAGLRIVHVGEVIGLRRQLAAIDLARAWRFDEQGAQLVGCADFEAQARLANAGWCGIAHVKGADGGAEMLVFARRVHAAPS